jgi:rRNA-processing protein FCF1
MKDVERILLDTNFLMDLFRFKLSFDDIEDVVGGPCSFLVVGQSVGELERMKSKYAKVGLSFIDSGKIKIVDAPGRTADDAIMSLLKKAKNRKEIKKTAVATNDVKLRKRIKALGVRVIYLRAKKHLEIIN